MPQGISKTSAATTINLGLSVYAVGEPPMSTGNSEFKLQFLPW